MTTPSKPNDVTTQSAIAPGAPHWTRNPHASRNHGHGYDFHDPTGLVKAYDGSGYKTGNAVTMFGKVGFHGSNAMVNTNHGKVYDMVFTRKYGTQGDFDFILETDPTLTNAAIGDFRTNVEHGFDVCEVDYDISTLNPGLTVIAPGKYKFTMPDGDSRVVFKVIVPYRTKVRTLDPIVLQKPITYWVRQFFWTAVGLDEYTTYNSRVGNIYGHIDEVVPVHNGFDTANFYANNPAHNGTTTWKKWWEAAPWEYTIDLVEDTYDVACLATDTAGAYSTATSYIGQVEQDNALYKVLTLPLPKSFVDPVVGIPEHNNWQNAASIWTHDLWYTVGNSYDCRITSRVYRCTDYTTRLSKDGRSPANYYYGEGTGGIKDDPVGTTGISSDGVHYDGSWYPSPRVNSSTLSYMTNIFGGKKSTFTGTPWYTESWDVGWNETPPAAPGYVWGVDRSYGTVGKLIGPMIDITYANANWGSKNPSTTGIFLRSTADYGHHGCKEELQRTQWGTSSGGFPLYNQFHRYSDDYGRSTGMVIRTCPTSCGRFKTHHPTGQPRRWLMHDGGNDLGTEIFGENQPKLPTDTVHRQFSNNGLKLGGYDGTGNDLNNATSLLGNAEVKAKRDALGDYHYQGDEWKAHPGYDKYYIETDNMLNWGATTVYADADQFDYAYGHNSQGGYFIDDELKGEKKLHKDLGHSFAGNKYATSQGVIDRHVPGEFFPHHNNRSPRVWAYSTCPIDHSFTIPSIIEASRLSHWAWPLTDIRLEPWSPTSGKTWEEWKSFQNQPLGTGRDAGLYGAFKCVPTIRRELYPTGDPMALNQSETVFTVSSFTLTDGSFDVILSRAGAVVETHTIPFSATSTNNQYMSGDGPFWVAGAASTGLTYRVGWGSVSAPDREEGIGYTVAIDTANATGSVMPTAQLEGVGMPRWFTYALSSIPAVDGAVGHHWNHYLAWQKESELKSHYDFVACPDNHTPETDYQSYRRDFDATPRSFWLTDYSQYKDDNLGHILSPEKIIDHIPLSPNGEDSGYNVMFNWTGMNDDVKARENSYRFCEPPIDEPSILNGARTSSKSTVGGGGKRFRTLADGKSSGTVGVNNTESKVYDDHQAYRSTFDLSQPWTTSVDSLSSDTAGSGEEGSSKCLFDIRGLLHEESTYDKNNTLKGYFKSCCNHEDKEIIFTLSKANDNDPVELDSIVQSRIYINKSNAYDVTAHAKYDDTVVVAHAMKPALIMAPYQGWDELPTDPSILDQLFVPEGAISMSDVLWLSLAAGALAGGTVPKAVKRSVTVKSIPILKSIPKTVKILTGVTTGTTTWTKTFENIGGDDITVKLDPDIHGKTPWDPVAETGDNTNDWAWSIVGPYNTDASGDVNSIVLKSTESVDVTYSITAPARTSTTAVVEYEVYHPYTTIQDIVYGAGPSGSVEFDVTYN